MKILIKCYSSVFYHKLRLNVHYSINVLVCIICKYFMYDLFRRLICWHQQNRRQIVGVSFFSLKIYLYILFELMADFVKMRCNYV